MKIPFFLLFIVFLTPTLLADKRHTPPPAFEPTFPWISDLDEAIKQSRQTGKPILAEFR